MGKQKSINTNNTDDSILKRILDEIKFLSTSKVGESKLTYGEYNGGIVYSRTPLYGPPFPREDVMELISKSNPKKVMRILGNRDGALCPTCLRIINVAKEQYNYCPTCGQRLDWE